MNTFSVPLLIRVDEALERSQLGTRCLCACVPRLVPHYVSQSGVSAT